MTPVFAGKLAVMLVVLWILLPLIAVLFIIWLGVRYFDRRYKSCENGDSPAKLLTGSFEPTKEVFIDPKDGHKFRVYYNRQTGERHYVRE